MKCRHSHRSGGLRRALLHACLLAALAACGPGSGGSGIPDGPAGTAPPPSSDSPPMASACPAPRNASATPYAGRVQALEAGCLLVADRWIALEAARFERRSAVVATADDLVVGILVTVVPDAEDPARAALVVIEDAG